MPQETLSTSFWNPDARQTIAWKLHWVLRLALFSEFVGHGAFGVLTKQAWVPYFGLVGIPEAWAWRLMPVVGSVDIAVGTLTLLAPRRALLLYMAGWGLWTALLRPLAGEGWWEFFERSYNFGLPFLMLWMHSVGPNVPSWSAVLTTMPRWALGQVRVWQGVLQGLMASMLIGHGGLGLVMGKASLLRLYDAVGLGSVGVPLPMVSAWMGGFEMLLGVCCVVVRHPGFFLVVCGWKLGTESFSVPAQASGAWWEVLERGSSYAAPLLWIGLQQWRQQTCGQRLGVPEDRPTNGPREPIRRAPLPSRSP